MDKKKKAIVLSFGLATLMLQALPMNAQVINKGLLQNPYKEQGDESGMLRRSTNGTNLGIEDFGANEGDINVEDFGTPLGSGILVLLTAGAGYATLKSKKQNETNKNKENKQ
jgi:hypothetical protein